LRRNGLHGEVVHSDLFDGVDGEYDIIVFNPPYLAAEDEGILEQAWSGGREGLEVLGSFLQVARHRLRPGGRIIVLLSSEMHREALDQLLDRFYRRRLASRRYFFEELWVEELRPC
jgi:release factor glutamine methyltransferase